LELKFEIKRRKRSSGPISLSLGPIPFSHPTTHWDCVPGLLVGPLRSGPQPSVTSTAHSLARTVAWGPLPVSARSTHVASGGRLCGLLPQQTPWHGKIGSAGVRSSARISLAVAFSWTRAPASSPCSPAPHLCVGPYGQPHPLLQPPGLNARD
jgi:hypothetical protein